MVILVLLNLKLESLSSEFKQSCNQTFNLYDACNCREPQRQDISLNISFNFTDLT